MTFQFLGTSPGWNWRGRSPIEYRDNLYVLSICPSICPHVCPPQTGPGLSEAGPGLSKTGSKLSEVGSGLSEVGSGLSETCSDLLEAGLGLSDATSGLSEAVSGLSKAGPGLPEASSGLSDVCHGMVDGQMDGQIDRWMDSWDIQIPPVFYRISSPSWLTLGRLPCLPAAIPMTISCLLVFGFQPLRGLTKMLSYIDWLWDMSQTGGLSKS